MASQEPETKKNKQPDLSKATESALAPSNGPADTSNNRAASSSDQASAVAAQPATPTPASDQAPTTAMSTVADDDNEDDGDEAGADEDDAIEAEDGDANEEEEKDEEEETALFPELSGEPEELWERFYAQLGFLETPVGPLTSDFFPCKAGGKPAWLNPKNLPSPKQLTCDHCNEPLRFLMQIYAPQRKQDCSFHRALFLFTCGKGSCLDHPGSVKVFRSQLPKDNPFYAHTEPLENPSPEIKEHPQANHHLCGVCGISGAKVCGRCRSVYYCGKAHQALHWKNGHQQECVAADSAVAAAAKPEEKPPVSSAVAKAHRKTLKKELFPEFEIEMDAEPDEDDSEETKKEKDLLERYEKEAASNSAAETPDEKEFYKKSFKKIDLDRWFTHFESRIRCDPDQVMRYRGSRTALPLWVNSKNRADPAAIPPCPSCGQTRTFEFQILPQILYLLRVDPNAKEAIDWGTLVVYTCPQSCGDGLAQGYVEEYVHRQAMET